MPYEPYVSEGLYGAGVHGEGEQAGLRAKTLH